MIFYFCAKFQSLYWLEVSQEQPFLEVHDWRVLMIPYQLLRGWGHPWHHGSSWWGFLMRSSEDWVILYIMDHNDMWFFTCLPNFSSPAWLEVCEELLILEAHTWRTLNIPDWSVGWWGHLWHLNLAEIMMCVTFVTKMWHTHKHACMHTCMHTHTQAHMHTHTRTHTPPPHTYTHTHPHTHAHMHACTHTGTHTLMHARTSEFGWDNDVCNICYKNVTFVTKM